MPGYDVGPGAVQAEEDVDQPRTGATRCDCVRCTRYLYLHRASIPHISRVEYFNLLCYLWAKGKRKPFPSVNIHQCFQVQFERLCKSMIFFVFTGILWALAKILAIIFSRCAKRKTGLFPFLFDLCVYLWAKARQSLHVFSWEPTQSPPAGQLGMTHAWVRTIFFLL